MKIRELYEELNRQIPPSLSCEWDNDGLMCCPQGDREVRRVLVTLDVTEGAVDAALAGEYDLIVSHHPLIFKGLKNLGGEDYLSEKVIRLLKADVSVFSFHTRLDAVSGGVNDRLAELLGLTDVTPFGDEGIGRIGTLPVSLTAEKFAATVRQALGAPYVNLGDAGKPVRRVAVLGGGGADDVYAAEAAGADTYVTGELKYHQLCDAPEGGINLIEAGHFYTEQPVTEVLAALIRETVPGSVCEIFHSNRVKAI